MNANDFQGQWLSPSDGHPGVKTCGTSPRKPAPAWGSAGLGCIYAAAEITVLGIPTLFVLVDLLK